MPRGNARQDDRFNDVKWGQCLRTACTGGKFTEEPVKSKILVGHEAKNNVFKLTRTNKYDRESRIWNNGER